MKKQTLYPITVSVICLFFGLFFGSQRAYAQSPEYVLAVQVPFDFQVRDSLLPAGKYIIKRNPQITNFLLIESTEQKISVVVSTLPHSLSKKTTKGSLTFRGYGEKHFLSEVKLMGGEEGYVLAESKAERSLVQGAEVKPICAFTKGLSMNK